MSSSSAFAGVCIVVLPEAIGDSIMSIPALGLIVEWGKYKKVVVACSGQLVQFYNSCSLPGTFFVKYADLAIRIRGRRIDLLVDFASIDWSISLVESIDVDIVASHHFFTDNSSGAPRHMYKISEKLYVSSFFDDNRVPFSGLDIGLIQTLIGRSESVEFVPELDICVSKDSDLNAIANKILFVPCGGNSLKKWPCDYWATLAGILGEANQEIHMVLGPLDSLPKGMPEFVHIKKGLSLLELGSYFLDFELIISNDCGPMHIAAALGCPLIAVFGPTDENKWFPYRGARQLSFRLGKAPSSGRDVLIPGQYWPYWPLPESIAISVVALMEDDN